MKHITKFQMVEPQREGMKPTQAPTMIFVTAYSYWLLIFLLIFVSLLSGSYTFQIKYNPANQVCFHWFYCYVAKFSICFYLKEFNLMILGIKKKCHFYVIPDFSLVTGLFFRSSFESNMKFNFDAKHSLCYKVFSKCTLIHFK